MSAVARINDWLWVGARDSCGAVPAELVVHVWRGDYPDHSCRYATDPEAPPVSACDVRVNYRDGNELSESNLRNLAAVADMLRFRRRPTLVHCHAGACRSPTLAAYLLASVESGLHPLEAFYLVERAIYDQRSGATVNYVHAPKRQLLAALETERRKP